MIEPRSYTTTTGEELFLPQPTLSAAERRRANIAELKDEQRRLDAEWDETAEQLLTLQNRRRRIAERRRSVRRTLEQIEALTPFTTEEKH